MGLETMSLSAEEKGNGGTDAASAPPYAKKKRRCKFFALACLLLLLSVILIVVILAATVFRVKQPKTQLVSASLIGVVPKISFPAIKVELNVTLNLTLLVENRNHASFKGQGESLLMYNGNQVGDVQLDSVLIPAQGTATLVCPLTLEADRFADSGLTALFKDVMDGEVAMETKTRIPGRVNFLGILRKHVVATSDCQIVIGLSEFKIKSQDCKQHTQL